METERSGLLGEFFFTNGHRLHASDTNKHSKNNRERAFHICSALFSWQSKYNEDEIMVLCHSLVAVAVIHVALEYIYVGAGRICSSFWCYNIFIPYFVYPFPSLFYKRQQSILTFNLCFFSSMPSIYSTCSSVFQWVHQSVYLALSRHGTSFDTFLLHL